MASAAEEIRKAVDGKNPVIYLVSPEEERVVDILKEIARDVVGDEEAVHTWSCVTGLSTQQGSGDTRDPVTALRMVMDGDDDGLFVMKDLPALMDDSTVIRALRDVYRGLGHEGNRFVFILSPALVIPDVLEKELYLIHVPPPDEDELLAHVKTVEAEYPGAAFREELYSTIIPALKGLTLDEVGHIMHRAFRLEAVNEEEMLDQIFAEKEMIVKRTGYLEFIPPRQKLDGLGGLDAMKDWLVRRKKVFTREAVAAGVPVPKGLLIMGMSGCGKSLAAKVISSLWNVPLFRLDMNLIFSGMYGSPEATFHATLKRVESISPAILWIDEIENGIGMQQDQGASASSTHIFSAFLTWMQEKPPLVFIAATANRIHDLPAEVIRKGRFDQVFFVDLPNSKERRQIFEIHLRGNGADPEDFDLEYFSVMSEGWNGAEIEQVVIAARVDAFHEDREMRGRDITNNAAAMVPLSKTMEEQMKRIRSWAFGRATPASKYGQKRK